jgi:hypothetical protein
MTLPDIKHWQKFYLFFIIFFHDAWQMSQGKKRKNKRSKPFQNMKPQPHWQRNIVLDALNFQLDSKDIKISKRFLLLFFFPCLPICPSKMCLETARHIFLVLPLTDFGSSPKKCAYQDPKAAMGSTKMCLDITHLF